MVEEPESTPPTLYCVLFDEKAEINSWQQAIRALGDALVEDGCIEPAYIEAVIEREKNYPTGLDFGGTGIALPHGMPSAIHAHAIAVGSFKKPVAFHRMDSADDIAACNLVILLAIDAPDHHLTMLSRLIDCLSESDRRNALINAKNIDMLRERAIEYLELA